MWAVANDMAFSAAYALASAANRVFLSRTGGVGSIGVIALHADQSGKDAQDGVRYTTVFAGARKNDLNPHAPLTRRGPGEPAGRGRPRLRPVRRHRGPAPRAHRPRRCGRTEAGLFFGRDAIDAGLADALGTREDALAQLTQTLAAGTPALPRLSLLTEDPSMKKTPELPAIPEPVLAPEATPEVAATAPVAPPSRPVTASPGARGGPTRRGAGDRPDLHPGRSTRADRGLPRGGPDSRAGPPPAARPAGRGLAGDRAAASPR